MAFLIARTGSAAGIFVEIPSHRFVIGRHPSSDFVLEGAEASRHHAEIIVDDGKFVIGDLRSRNGTYVNDSLLKSPQELRDHDIIRIGDAHLQFAIQKPPEGCLVGGGDNDLLSPEIRFSSLDIHEFLDALERSNVHVYGAGSRALEEQIVDTGSILRKMLLSASFHPVVVFDCQRGMSGKLLVNSEAFVRHMGRQLGESLGIRSEDHAFHPEQVAQLVQDLKHALYVFIHAECLDDQMLHHLRGMGFNSNENRTVFSGDNALLEQLSRGKTYSATNNRSGADNDSVISRIESQGSSAHGGNRSNVRPEVKLRAVLEISAALGRVLNLNEVCPVILQSLFRIFPQADAGFVILEDPHTTKLKVRASLCENPDGDEVPISMTVVRQAMDQSQAILSADVMGDRRFRSSESLTDLKLRSLMCAPVMANDGRAIGVIQLSTLDASHPFTSDDLDLLMSVSAQASLAVENATLHDAMLHLRDLERDMKFAEEVQQSFLPYQDPCVDGYEFAHYYKAAFHVGADYFDFVPLTDGRMAMAIGHVAGTGVSAAIIMGRLHASVRYHFLSSSSPAQAMDRLNSEVCGGGRGCRFITLIVAVLDPKTHQICIANAGHLPPVYQTVTNGNYFFGLVESGLPLGVLAEQKFNEVTIGLKPDESLLLYTAGITEAKNSSNELYGRDRLKDAIQSQHSSAKEMVMSLNGSVESFCNSSPQRDDVCVVAIRRTS